MPHHLFNAAPHELAAILSGLRMLQSEMDADGAQFSAGDTLTDGGTVKPISPDEIDALCETLNADLPRFFIVEHLNFLRDLVTPEDADAETVLFWNTSDGWGDLPSATAYTIRDLLGIRLPMGADVRWVNADDLTGTAYRSIFRTRADLMGLPAFVWLANDSSGNPCVWANHYTCDDCESEWTDHWSCQCDDECGDCGHDLSPAVSDWIGPKERHWIELWEALPEA